MEYVLMAKLVVPWCTVCVHTGARVSVDQCPFSETGAAKRCDERGQTRWMNLTPTSRSTVAENIPIIMIAVKSIDDPQRERCQVIECGPPLSVIGPASC